MSGFAVRAKLVISADDFDPCLGVEDLPQLEKKWRKGEKIHPNRQRKYPDTGFSLVLLDETSSPDWCDDLILSLEKIVPSLQSLMDISILPAPLISIYVDTDGERFPPLYLSRKFMGFVQLLQAEIDIDVIASLD